MGTKKVSAYAVLPESWVASYASYYRARGHQVETGPAKKGWFIRIHGISREEFHGFLNDPLGKPGERQTRHPRYRKIKVRELTPDELLDKAWADEEAHYSRPE
jgi:hypothetical protein